MKPTRPSFIKLSAPSVDEMATLCFVCGEPILSQHHSAIWKLRVPNSTPPSTNGPSAAEQGGSGGTATNGAVSQQDDGGQYVGRPYHEACLKCVICGLSLTGTNFTRAKLTNGTFRCDLHFSEPIVNDVESDDFMRKLREFKEQSLGCAVARRKSSTTLQFPLPAQACPGSDSCDRYPHAIKGMPGYWIECNRQFSLTVADHADQDHGAENGQQQQQQMATLMPPTNPASMQKSNTLEDMYNKLGTFELTVYEEETYQKYFYGSEHWNYFTNDEALGPVILSLKQETCNSRDQFRYVCVLYLSSS